MGQAVVSLLVADSKAFDHLAALVGQEGEGDGGSIGEAGEGFDRIVADPGDLYARLLQLAQVLLQFN